jgi:hypothetical protein
MLIFTTPQLYNKQCRIISFRNKCRNKYIVPRMVISWWELPNYMMWIMFNPRCENCKTKSSKEVLLCYHTPSWILMPFWKKNWIKNEKLRQKKLYSRNSRLNIDEESWVRKLARLTVWSIVYAVLQWVQKTNQKICERLKR